ncbi:hypothetical protein ACGFIG_00070 [Micromonospora sp. NPDC049048]|uniref:hypothetical protein n=1 Tax=Micromonospora sp. NPDC049048 TaxID=3364263 RepID=UPI00371D521D
MQDRFDNQGRTRWRRFAAMMVPATARSTHAGTFNLTGLTMKANVGADAKECF